MLNKIYNWIFPTKKTNILNNNQPIEYWVNDPTTPELIGSTIYSGSVLPIDVSGFVGGGHKMTTPEGRAANCYAIVNNTVGNITPKMKKFPGRWAATSKLNVYPTAGQDLNAFYDRHSLKFFYALDPVVKKNIYTADSSDIVSHETGHALLDAIRPDFWNVQSYEVWALHESFGDIVAILNIMENKDLVNMALKQTSGDLSKSNVISKLAEELAKAIFNITKGKKGYSPLFLRDAANNFNYVSPDRLSDNTPDNVLSRECHNFSRVWTGAWYACLVGIYNFNVKNNINQYDSLMSAKDIMARYFFEAVQNVPMTARLFEALAKKIILIDSGNGSKYSETLNKVFTERNIIGKISLLNNFSFDNVKGDKKFLKIESEGTEIYSDMEKIKTLKISDYVSKKDILNKNLYNVEIEVPFEDRYELSKGGIFIQSTNNIEENVNIAVMCLNSLSKNNLLGNLFKVENNKLVRNKFIN